MLVQPLRLSPVVRGSRFRSPAFSSLAWYREEGGMSRGFPLTDPWATKGIIVVGCK